MSYDVEKYPQVRDKATGELVQNLTSAAPRFLVSRTHIDMSDQIVEVFDQIIDVCDQTIEVFDQIIEACDQIIEVFDQIIEVSDQIMEVFDQIIDVCDQIMAKLNPHSGQ